MSSLSIGGEMAMAIAGRISKHTYRDGGTMALLLGDKGAGKTTGLLNLAAGVSCRDDNDPEWQAETVIWRARSIDYWTRIDPGRRTVWLHCEDVDRIRFSADGVRPMVPPVRTYESTADLLDQIQTMRGITHVIYSPSGMYEIDEGFRDELAMDRKEVLKALLKRHIDIEALFWYELFYVLTRHTSREFFCTVVLDELQRLFPPSTRGLRYHIQALIALEILPDFRKQNKSLVAAAHSTQNIDYRIYPLIQVYGYMRGARPIKGSQVKVGMGLQDPGVVMWDAGNYGRMRFNMTPNLPLVIADRDRVKMPNVILNTTRRGSEYLGDVDLPVLVDAEEDEG